MPSPALISAPSSDIPTAVGAATRPAVAKSWQLKAVEDLAKWAWLVAITASFLSIGIAGLWGGIGPVPVLVSFKAPSADLDSSADSAMMAELVAESAPSEVAPEVTTDIQEVPPPVEITPQSMDLPELAEALATEDVFTIPTAPKIEDALQPVDPVAPKPEVKRVTSTKPSTPRRPTSTRPAISGSGTGAGTGTGGGGGSGTGNFVIPRPSYPSTLRSMGVQGTVRLRIVVGASGRASSVTVIGTSGNSTLDQYAAGWVRRNGKAPPGEVRTVIAPLSFVLR